MPRSISCHISHINIRHITISNDIDMGEDELNLHGTAGQGAQNLEFVKSKPSYRTIYYRSVAFLQLIILHTTKSAYIN